ncbi:MAG: type 2 isopentenyl-diphosphate Delta-isomerase [Candidatus Aenigmarchaeota archaeon]|nr:type 2 isopentenyl-diphosphate Delta-isomerase [Candidatus Aenigmarchaeota archaeon]NIQ17285.1 type 2 isopentenyl-diphosphate Delta-isomerase [Candidatus Aenigmarchaeota archaeon]NIS73146.1 type 2 isopentenyl-diphosphate Delta-isomerase [Candidatus Aenigmarchaeota archaeon]
MSVTMSRKDDHIRICLEKKVEFVKSNGFEHVELEHKALPEIDKDEIDLETKFLGKKFNYPLFIEAMTGGTKEGERINKNLAKAAEALGIGMGVGSQRAMLEDSKLARTYFVRDVAKNMFLLGNIGAVQLPQYDVENIISLVDSIKADGLAVHLNVAQELAQKEGDKSWKGVYSNIKYLCKKAKFPVIAKETGCGISGKLSKDLVRAGVKAIDVAGAGGTSWVKVDSFRTKEDFSHIEEWGIPTAEALRDVAKSVKVPIIASGGIRNGSEVAKAIAMGASLVGLALPLLKPATESADRVKERLEKIISQLRDAMFLVGARNMKELRKVRVIYL